MPPAAPPSRARWEKKHGTGQALTGLAPPWARAVSPRLQREVACERETGFPRSGRGADAPGASLDTQGTTLQEALDTAVSPAAVHAKAPRGHAPLRPAPLLGPPLSLLWPPVLGAKGRRGLRLTRTWLSLANAPRCPCALPRTVGGPREVARAQRTPRPVSARVAQAARAPPDVCGAATSGLRQRTEIPSDHAPDC